MIASKVYFNPGRLSPEAIHQEIDGSLKRLGTDYLDLYIIHRFDYETPIEETMEALNDLVKAGKVRALELRLTPEDVAYLEEPYLPHRIVGAIDRNPPDGTVLLDEKK